VIGSWRARLVVLAVAALAATTMVAAPAQASLRAPDAPYYVSLGDSLAFG